MIYLDHGATSFEKPRQVEQAMARAVRMCGNPGRGGHEPAMEAAETVYRCRAKAARLFDCEEEYLPQELLAEIQRIVSGSTYVIFACIIKKGMHWKWDGLYYDLPDDEMNSMDAFRNTVSEIKSPKSWWKKLTGKTDVYEIFNWTNYEKIVK